MASNKKLENAPVDVVTERIQRSSVWFLGGFVAGGLADLTLIEQMDPLSSAVATGVAAVISASCGYLIQRFLLQRGDEEGEEEEGVGEEEDEYEDEDDDEEEIGENELAHLFDNLQRAVRTPSILYGDYQGIDSKWCEDAEKRVEEVTYLLEEYTRLVERERQVNHNLSQYIEGHGIVPPFTLFFFVAV